MRQIAPLAYAWSVYEAARRQNVTGHFLQAAPGEAGVLMDPVPFQDGDVAHVRDLGGVAAVVVTQPGRVDVARRCAETFGTQLLAVLGLPGAGIRTEPLTTGTLLPGGLLAVALPVGYDPAVPDVVALAHPPSGSALLAGAVVGAPAGALSLAPGIEGERAAHVAHRVRGLLSFGLQRVLVAEGEPVLREAVQAVQELVFRHDPAAFLLRPEELAWQPPRGRGTRFLRQSAECSRLMGLRTLDFEVTLVPPGKQSTLLHRHAGYEELFIILEGSGEVETPRGTFPIQAGDALGFPAANHVAHGIRNTGEVYLRMLSFGAPPPTDEAADIAAYPESNKLSIWDPSDGGRRFYLPAQQQVDYWEGERLD